MAPKSNHISPWTIASKLQNLGFETQVEVDHEGQRLDVLAFTPNGSSLALEVKNWRQLDEEMIAKARKQSELLSKSAEVDNAWIVIPSLPSAHQETSVFNLDGLVRAAENLIGSEPDFGLRGTHGMRQRKPGSSEKKETKRIFVAMPFAEQFEDTYYLGIIPAARRASAVCIRVDQNYLSQQILDAIHTEIRLSDLVVADLTNANPNVTYELGFAHALKKPSIHISATQPEYLPFDLRQWSTQYYKFGNVHELARKLSDMIQHALAENNNSMKESK
jgi:hypothetical protein